MLLALSVFGTGQLTLEAAPSVLLSIALHGDLFACTSGVSTWQHRQAWLHFQLGSKQAGFHQRLASVQHRPADACGYP